MEQLNVITPNVYVISKIIFDWENKYILIQLKSTLTGEVFLADYKEDIAINLMKKMNETNFSINSMHKTVLSKLINDGKISGTISGEPE